MRNKEKVKELGKSGLIISGHVELKVLDANTGQLIEQMEGSNLVVNLGRINLAKLVGGDPTGLPVTKVGFGEGSATPTPADISLTNVFIKNIDSATYPTNNQVMFTFTLAAGEGNGLNINEIGLFNSSNVLVARKTRATIIKTSAIIIAGLWVLNIS